MRESREDIEKVIIQNIQNELDLSDKRIIKKLYYELIRKNIFNSNYGQSFMNNLAGKIGATYNKESHINNSYNKELSSNKTNSIKITLFNKNLSKILIIFLIISIVLIIVKIVLPFGTANEDDMITFMKDRGDYNKLEVDDKSEKNIDQNQINQSKKSKTQELNTDNNGATIEEDNKDTDEADIASIQLGQYYSNPEDEDNSNGIYVSNYGNGFIIFSLEDSTGTIDLRDLRATIQDDSNVYIWFSEDETSHITIKKQNNDTLLVTGYGNYYGSDLSKPTGTYDFVGNMKEQTSNTDKEDVNENDVTYIQPGIYDSDPKDYTNSNTLSVSSCSNGIVEFSIMNAAGTIDLSDLKAEIYDDVSVYVWYSEDESARIMLEYLPDEEAVVVSGYGEYNGNNLDDISGNYYLTEKLE